jgi:ATP-dependent RNA helicase RhlE
LTYYPVAFIVYIMTEQTFSGLGIAPNLLNVIGRLKFTTPTPIQHKAIPIAMEGKDIMGIAQTGTGKTLAFAIPMIQRLTNIKGRGLIIVPTRELALQVDETFQKFRSIIGAGTAVLIGGASMGNQLRMLRRNPRIIIATPGRLIDHIQQRTVSLDDIRILVLDEADRMLDMGFAPQIAKVLQGVPAERQTMLFSATMPPEIMRLASSYMKLPVSVEIARSGTAVETVVQEIFIVRNEDKRLLLEKILYQYHGSVLLFTRTKYGASKIVRVVKELGHSAAEIHSNRSFSQRREALDGFKSGKYRVLVATDIAARGIDVTGIELVINYDLPEDPENYIHRIGRTARAGLAGRAISFAMPDQGRDVRDIEMLIRTALPVSKHPEVPSADFYGGHKPKPHPTGFAYRGLRRISTRRHGRGRR